MNFIVEEAWLSDFGTQMKLVTPVSAWSGNIRLLLMSVVMRDKSAF